jgi:hypothetical protein
VCAGADTVVDNGQDVVYGEYIQALLALLVTTGAAINAECDKCDKCGYIYVAEQG